MRSSVLIGAGVLGWVLAGCGGGPTGAPDSAKWTYDFVVDDNVQTAAVTACTPGGTPRLESPDPTIIVDFRVEGDCAHFTLELFPAAVASGREDLALYALPNLVLKPTLWLARPDRIPEGQRATIRMKLPPGWHAVVPWAPTGENSWRVDWSAFRVTGQMVITQLAPRTLKFEETSVQMTTVGRPLEAPQNVVDAWILDAMKGVATIYGEFPVKRLMILVIGSPGAEVGFGMTQRGGGAGVLIFAGHETPAEGYAGDWTMAHELIHLGMPRLEEGDEWFSEGITSYFTHLVRARAGVIDPTEAWSKLHDGFVRGTSRRTNRTLADESKSMSRTGAYWAVYWGGAAFAALADAQLRREGRSLDEVMRYWRGLGDTALWYSASSLIARADDEFEGAGLSALAAGLLAEKPIPAARIQALFKAYGIEPESPDRVKLVKGSESVARDAIMTPESAR